MGRLMIETPVKVRRNLQKRRRRVGEKKWD
jgi:hypothetical protein